MPDSQLVTKKGSIPDRVNLEKMLTELMMESGERKKKKKQTQKTSVDPLYPAVPKHLKEYERGGLIRRSGF